MNHLPQQSDRSSAQYYNTIICCDDKWQAISDTDFEHDLLSRVVEMLISEPRETLLVFEQKSRALRFALTQEKQGQCPGDKYGDLFHSHRPFADGI